MLRLLALLGVTLSLFARDTTDLKGSPQDPFRNAASAYVLLFVRTDCPITNRYAPELKRIRSEYASQNVAFFLVYPDRTETVPNVRKQIEQYGFPGNPILDPDHKLVARARVSIAPEAAVFDSAAKLIYHGRIDNRWVDVGRSRPVATVHDLEDAIAATIRGKSVAEAHTQAIGCSLADVR